MANTTNLNMVKPAGTDHALISVINSNMDIIDGAVGALPSGTTLQGEIDSANTAIGNIDPKRGDISAVANDTYLIGLDAGTYQVVLSSGTAVTNGYVPAQYGTLIVNDSGKNYKSYTFVTTGNAVYSRICHKGNSTWYTVWQRLAVIESKTYTGTTNTNGLIYPNNIPTGATILNAYTAYGTTALMQFGASGFRAYDLSNGSFNILANTSITITYYYRGA